MRDEWDGPNSQAHAIGWTTAKWHTSSAGSFKGCASFRRVSTPIQASDYREDRDQPRRRGCSRVTPPEPAEKG